VCANFPRLLLPQLQKSLCTAVLSIYKVTHAHPALISHPWRGHSPRPPVVQHWPTAFPMPEAAPQAAPWARRDRRRRFPDRLRRRLRRHLRRHHAHPYRLRRYGRLDWRASDVGAVVGWGCALVRVLHFYGVVTRCPRFLRPHVGSCSRVAGLWRVLWVNFATYAFASEISRSTIYIALHVHYYTLLCITSE
jgi:hypothetical protein